MSRLSINVEAFYEDEAPFGAFRAGAEYVVQGTSRSELYEDVPMEAFGDS
ncbi:MAG TPA: hypothetical protein VKS25_02000 [Solirubrobacteraceae bacterium]|nr:hypothetical protein [Solirubrobacteraceae bacterium]